MPKTEVTPEMMAKLPKWARDLLRDKDNTIRMLNEDVKALKTGPEESRVHWEASLGQAEGNLPEHARITFFMGNGDRLIEAIDVRLQEDDWLGREIRISGGSGILVRPDAGNAVAIRLRDDRRDMQDYEERRNKRLGTTG